MQACAEREAPDPLNADTDTEEEYFVREEKGD